MAHTSISAVPTSATSASFGDRVSVQGVRLGRTGLIFSSQGASVCSHVSSTGLGLELSLAGNISALKLGFSGGGVLF